jgi:hypothetical protein
MILICRSKGAETAPVLTANAHPKVLRLFEFLFLVMYFEVGGHRDKTRLNFDECDRQHSGRCIPFCFLIRRVTRLPATTSVVKKEHKRGYSPKPSVR